MPKSIIFDGLRPLAFVSPFNAASAGSAVQHHTKTIQAKSISDSNVPTTGPYSYAIVSVTGGGTATINATTGSIVYTAGTFIGTATVTYKVTSAKGLEVLDSFTLSVTANQAPTANNVSLSGGANGTLTGTLTATDPEGDAKTFSIYTGATGGAVTLSANGSYSWTLPASAGVYSFTYRVADAYGAYSAVKTVTATVQKYGISAVYTWPGYVVPTAAGSFLSQVGNTLVCVVSVGLVAPDSLVMWTPTGGGSITPPQDTPINSQWTVVSNIRNSTDYWTATLRRVA